MIIALALAVLVTFATANINIFNFNNAPSDPSYVLAALNLNLGSKALLAMI